MAVVWRAAIKQKRELVLFYFYFSFIAVVWRPARKEPTIKQKFLLFYFYISFIAVVRPLNYFILEPRDNIKLCGFCSTLPFSDNLQSLCGSAGDRPKFFMPFFHAEATVVLVKLNSFAYCVEQVYTLSADIIRSLSDCESHCWWSSYSGTLVCLPG